MKKFYRLNKIIFLIIIFLFFINIKNVFAANEGPDILCPSSGEEPTEILIYYHGLLTNQGATSPYNYFTHEGSLSVFTGQINAIRSAIPGIIGVHIKTNACLDSSSCTYYNNNLSIILSKINTSCGISNASSLPLSIAGHSNGGAPMNSMKGSATNKVIFLDALYGNYAASVPCEKLIIVGGQTNHDSRFNANTESTNTRCSGKTGYIYEEGAWPGINNHYNTIGRLSALYTGAEGLTSTKPEFIKSPDLNPLGQLNVKIPGIDELVAKYPIVCEGDDKESCKIPWIGIYIYALYNYLVGIGGFLAAIALMIGGVLWLISAGNANRVSQAKSWITGSLTGLIILLTSYVLLYEINPELLGMRYIKMETIEPLYSPDYSNSLSNPTYVNSAGLNPYATGCVRTGWPTQACKDYCSNNVMPEGMVMIDDKYKMTTNVVDEEDNLKYMINPDIYEKYKKAIDCINPNKVTYTISNSWRSACRQIEFKVPGNKYGVIPSNAAPPCCSNHGGGLAIDLDPSVYNAAHIKCFKDNGLIRNLDVPNGTEAWHFSESGY